MIIEKVIILDKSTQVAPYAVTSTGSVQASAQDFDKLNLPDLPCKRRRGRLLEHGLLTTFACTMQ